jgi:thiol-disulfide isomerase/thioredoxin
VVLLFLSLPALSAPEMIPVEVFEAARQPAHAPDATIELPLREGGTFRLGDQRGSSVILAFWASWCAPCRIELPALSAWAKEHPEVKVLAVNVDRTRPPADRFLASVHFDLPVAFDPDASQLGRYGVTSMPTMFLFDREGKLAWQHSGFSKENGFSELDAALGGGR